VDASPLAEQEVRRQQRRTQKESLLQVPGQLHPGNLLWGNPAFNQQRKSLKH